MRARRVRRGGNATKTRPHNGEVEPDRACDRRRLLVRHMQAYVVLKVCPNVIVGIELRMRENVQGCYRRIVNNVLPLLFGPTYAPASRHYKAPAVFRAHAEIVRLATRGRVVVSEDQVRAGPQEARDVGPLVTKAKQTTPYYVNTRWLEHFGVTTKELRELFVNLPIPLFELAAPVTAAL